MSPMCPATGPLCLLGVSQCRQDCAHQDAVQVTSYQPRDYKAPQNGRIKSLHPLGTEADRLQVGSAATNPDSSRTPLQILLLMILKPVLALACRQRGLLFFRCAPSTPAGACMCCQNAWPTWQLR